MTPDLNPLLGDLPPDEARAALSRAATWAADYRQSIDKRPVVQSVVPGSIARLLREKSWESGVSIQQIMVDFDEMVMPGVVSWGSPAFLGYFGSTSNTPALVGEIVAAALNVSAMTWKTSPAATEMETVVVGWIQEILGIDTSFMGIVYDTASVSTMHALAAARERCGVDVRTSGVGEAGAVLRIYTSDQAHSSIVKSAILLGIGERNVVRIPTNADFEMDATLLKVAIDADMEKGFKPMAVVATIGTTSTASVDPVPSIADICVDRNIWLHIDAAYGAALAALPEGRWVMAGTDRADSIVVNPHKWMFVPLDFSALYIRHPDVLRSVFSIVPEYLRGDARKGDVIDYMDYGIQLGRRFRALKAWMVFRAFGKTGIESRIREHCRLAGEFVGYVQREADFHIAARPLMAVVCFRYARTDRDKDKNDRLNEIVAERVNASGTGYITTTVLKGRTVLRIGIGNISTTSAHVEAVWKSIVEAANSLK